MIEFRVESLESASCDIIPFLFAHYEEIEAQEGYALEPDFERYNLIDEAGKLHIVTARNGSQLMGYHVSIIDTLLHQKSTLAAISDLYWLHPKCRGGRTALRLFKFVEASLAERGVHVMLEGTKTWLNQSRLFEHLGFTRVEYRYLKWVGN